jgi:hypothetical protein
MFLGFITDEIFFHLFDRSGEESIDFFGRMGIVHFLGHDHSDGQVRQNIE